MKTRQVWIGVLAALVAGACSAKAGLFLDFQDLSNLGSGSIPEGYWGFAWGGDWQFETAASGNTYVFSGNGGDLTLQRANGRPFSLEGADFAGLSASDSVTVEGFAGDTFVGSLQTGPLPTTFSTFPTLIENIDTLVFTGTNWRMDNFADTFVVPEPTTIFAGALLLLPFGFSTLKILRRRWAS